MLKNLWLLSLFAMPFLAWLLPSSANKSSGDLSSEKVNLALRRTADGLLRLSGDSTSRIPAIEQTGECVWKVQIDQEFNYDQLPALLQSSLDLYGIQRPYEVAVRRCFDGIIDLGYHQQDFVQNNVVPCGGRATPDGCHFIEITFAENGENKSFGVAIAGFLLLLAGGLAGILFFRRQNKIPVSPEDTMGTDWLEIGNSRLDVAGQVLHCGGVGQALTFRETKLLRLFATNPDRLLERDFILQQVWADEGIMVGRSVDVFVSRLRKKLAADPSVGIVAIHGVGYRMETGKSA
jgi:DNA-binding winged helix-turn-helix (wHTH) protein